MDWFDFEENEQDMEETTEGIRYLEEALDRWMDAEIEDADIVLDLILQLTAVEESVVVCSEENDMDLYDWNAFGLTDNGLESNSGNWITRLEHGEGLYWNIVYTSKQQSPQEDQNHIYTHSLREIMNATHMEEKCIGLVFNPEKHAFFLPMPVIISMLQMTRELSYDEIHLNLGIEAYQRGDFEAAVMHYRVAEEAGNMDAISNIGYCCYYGRGVPVNKAKAKECWEIAAESGNICALYKLGDMYRNGDLPIDLERSKAYYMEAYEAANDYGDIYNYPDAVLRILKYCAEEFPYELLTEIARIAVQGLKQRIEEGDHDSDEVLTEAEECLRKLETEGHSWT